MPDIAPLGLWRCARLFADRHERSASTSDLDAFLSFAPWRSEEALSRYYAAISAGWIEGVGMLDLAMFPDDAIRMSIDPCQRRGLAARCSEALDVGAQPRSVDLVSDDSRSVTIQPEP